MQRTVFIMRGVPGSGKSTVARKIASSYPGEFKGTDPEKGHWETDYAIHSTDDLCIVDGEYQFDIELAGERHAQNLENFRASLDKRVPCVIVDNTNVKVSQFAPYVEAAHDAAYAVVFVELHHPALMVAVDRNTHGVPLETISEMMHDWEPSQRSDRVDEEMAKAAKVVELMQSSMKAFIWAGVGVGSFLGAFVVAVAWLIWPGC
jgi:2',3'-cyclic-nucleotide 3'-phosphodiesterase